MRAVYGDRDRERIHSHDYDYDQAQEGVRSLAATQGNYGSSGLYISSSEAKEDNHVDVLQGFNGTNTNVTSFDQNMSISTMSSTFKSKNLNMYDTQRSRQFQNQTNYLDLDEDYSSNYETSSSSDCDDLGPRVIRPSQRRVIRSENNAQKERENRQMNNLNNSIHTNMNESQHIHTHNHIEAYVGIINDDDSSSLSEGYESI